MKSDDWNLGFYYVKPLHRTMEFLKWNYGALDQKSEDQYVRSLLKMKLNLVKEREDDYIFAKAYNPKKEKRAEMPYVKCQPCWCAC